jgi:predicted ABC-type ATPase
LFIALGSPEKNINRIRERVARGGHFIPDPDVRCRYARGFENLSEAVRMADIAKIYDNSGDKAILVLRAEGGQVVWRAGLLPEWLAALHPAP